MDNTAIETSESLAVQEVVPLSDLMESPLNPRKLFDELKMQEMVSSIARLGVLVPLIVRPNPGMTGLGAPKFEIVAGARRFRGAKLAGKTEVPVIIRQFTDVEALESMLVENIQRNDLHPLEEAEALHRLKELGVPIDELPLRLGREKPPSRSDIYATLELLRLSEKAREAFLAKKFNKSIALVIAGVGDEKLQAQALKDYLEGRGGATVRDFREWVRTHYMLDLTRAPFDTKDPDLTEAGACMGCPFRTGTTPDLFEGVGKDFCTKSSCYQDKVAADWKQKVEERKAQGLAVLADADMAKVFHPETGHLRPDADYRRADDLCDDDPKRRTFKALLGKAARLAIVLAKSPKGEEIELLPKEGMRERLREAGHDFWAAEAKSTRSAAAKSGASKKSHTEDIEDPEAAKRARERTQREAIVRGLVVTRIVAAVEKTEPGKPFWRALIQSFLDAGSSEYALQRRFGKEEDPKALEKWLAKAGEPQLRGLAFELALEDALYEDTAKSTLKELCKIYKVDEGEVRAEVKEAQKAAADLVPRNEFTLRAQGEGFKTRINGDDTFSVKCKECEEEWKAPMVNGDLPRSELTKLEKHQAEHKKAKKGAK